MGNEQSVSEEPTQTEKIPEKRENGSVNGPSEISGQQPPESRAPASPQPQSASAEPTPEEETAPETEEEGQPEQNPVMNFFKTLVTPTKPTKKSSAAPDATKDQSEKENQAAATSTVAQVSEPPAAPKGMSVPPPPPPEPPKMETKGETGAKAAKTAPKEEPKGAVKEAEPSKGKSAKDAFGKFFRAKTNKEPQPEAVVQAQPDVEVQETAVVEAEPGVALQQTLEEPQPEGEEEKVDPSKTGTLEAAPKPEPPPPVQEKKPAAKSGFMSMFKSKAADPKKASPEVPAAAEPAPPVKTKEEPKPAAKTSETTAESKAAVTAAQTGDDAPSAPKKLEKRNSVQLFFKILSQKRNSTDAGIQTDPAAAEKSK